MPALRHRLFQPPWEWNKTYQTKIVYTLDRKVFPYLEQFLKYYVQDAFTFSSTKNMSLNWS